MLYAAPRPSPERREEEDLCPQSFSVIRGRLAHGFSVSQSSDPTMNGAAGAGLRHVL